MGRCGGPFSEGWNRFFIWGHFNWALGRIVAHQRGGAVGPSRRVGLVCCPGDGWFVAKEYALYDLGAVGEEGGCSSVLGSVHPGRVCLA